MERLGCRRLGDLLGYDFGLCFALGGDSGGGQLGGLLGGCIVRQLLEDFGQVITRSQTKYTSSLQPSGLPEREG